MSVPDRLFDWQFWGGAGRLTEAEQIGQSQLAGRFLAEGEDRKGRRGAFITIAKMVRCSCFRLAWWCARVF